MTKKPHDHIRHDLAGYPFNYKYPPIENTNSGIYHRYRYNTEETFFYDFAVQRDDLRFSYNGKEYYFLSTDCYVAQCDEPFTNEICRYIDGNDVIGKHHRYGLKADLPNLATHTINSDAHVARILSHLNVVAFV